MELSSIKVLIGSWQGNFLSLSAGSPLRFLQPPGNKQPIFTQRHLTFPHQITMLDFIHSTLSAHSTLPSHYPSTRRQLLHPTHLPCRWEQLFPHSKGVYHLCRVTHLWILASYLGRRRVLYASPGGRWRASPWSQIGREEKCARRLLRWNWTCSPLHLHEKLDVSHGSSIYCNRQLTFNPFSKHS